MICLFLLKKYSQYIVIKVNLTKTEMVEFQTYHRNNINNVNIFLNNAFFSIIIVFLANS